ncbi:8734_t:CDS:2 [Ambispora gerdemannii]|uniref:8734_t:CDS:1 n=1 Tax=Ambispora gerdemannii TaxID=144530 RepID=A0A9N8WAR0_9GLOM|nr:8734_t:CDS:2 [Ambispora gerdemannii]
MSTKPDAFYESYKKRKVTGFLVTLPQLALVRGSSIARRHWYECRLTGGLGLATGSSSLLPQIIGKAELAVGAVNHLVKLLWAELGI